ncbi:DUF4870 domain-containing protein [Chryseobacterium jejuense]|uniref:Predicted membrane protein n=1 Tax=Chryseobacterium jejuense TaxID=445960 RepID=A0A2X2WR26_CHRJE|nr:DUF4870 domain-containing protein [Chryseobacterium jejuense]SDJ65414.1 hypothetical protein SAMN05421542_4039 [Chryseobacterium jejuense]SQB43248.1 Predicted membrane protein [Chryseobacterium jejuense]
MDNKTLSIVSYITIIGWLIAFIAGKDKADSLLRYHLKQSLGAAILSFILPTILGILISVTHLGILGIIAILPLVLMIIGAINAANEVEKPLPLIGKIAEEQFSFIG